MMYVNVRFEEIHNCTCLQDIETLFDFENFDILTSDLYYLAGLDGTEWSIELKDFRDMLNFDEEQQLLKADFYDRYSNKIELYFWIYGFFKSARKKVAKNVLTGKLGTVDT